MDDRFLPVLLEYRQAVNPEPGVARAPSLAEQRRAIGRLVTTWGGQLSDDAVIARGGPEPLTIDLDEHTTGVVMFSVQALQRGPAIDIELARSIWSRVDTLAFFVENLRAHDDETFAGLIDLFMVMNAVIARDSSTHWRDLVLASAERGSRTPPPHRPHQPSPARP